MNAYMNVLNPIPDFLVEYIVTTYKFIQNIYNAKPNTTSENNSSEENSNQ
jgi:hypothetical protein